MSGQFVRSLLVVMLLLPFGGQAGQAPYRYSVSGRVVDNSGQPVPNALIFLSLPHQPNDWIEEGKKTAADGRFHWTGTTSEPVSKLFLHVTSPPPLKAYTPFTPPFNELNGSSAGFPGQPVHVQENQGIDVGDARIQVYYGVIIFRLENQESKPLLTGNEDGEDMRVRIRDARGDVVYETGLSKSDCGEAISMAHSAIRLALPQGEWGVELSPDRGRGLWLTSDAPVVVQGSDTPLQVTLKPHPREDRIPSGSIYSAEVARQELRRMGFEFSEKSFLERASRLNAKAVRLFLDAGMNPNVKDKDGATPLIEAAMQGGAEVVQLLINKGADVNGKTNEGTTALMSAATGGHAAIVRILLAKGADVNIQHENGSTALMSAVNIGATEVVKDLLAAGADVSLKTQSGTTALDIAKGYGNEEIIKLLDKAQHKNK